MISHFPSSPRAAAATDAAPIAVAPTEERGKFFYLSTSRSGSGSVQLIWHDASAKKEQEVTYLNGLVDLSANPIVWLPSADRLVGIFPMERGAQLLVVSPNKEPRPKHPAMPYELWEWRETTINEGGIEGCPVLYDASQKAFLTAKRRFVLEKDEPAQKGYFKPAPYPGLNDPRYREYLRVLRVLDNIMAVSDDGKLALSATNLYDAATYTLKGALPFPCAVSAVGKNTAYLFDPLGKRIVVWPVR